MNTPETQAPQSPDDIAAAIYRAWYAGIPEVLSGGGWPLVNAIALAIAAERTAADHRVAEALKRAAGLVCTHCLNRMRLAWPRNVDEDYSHIDDRRREYACRASSIYFLIAAEEARNVE
jgi:hypothetical protein